MNFDAEVARGFFHDGVVTKAVIGKITVTASRVPAGVNSRDFANLLPTLAERVGLKIPMERALAISLLRALAEYGRAPLG